MLNRYQGVFRGTITNPGSISVLYEAHITLVGGDVNGIIGFLYGENTARAYIAGTLTLIDISTTSLTVEYEPFIAEDYERTMVMRLLSDGEQLEVTYLADDDKSQTIGTLDRIS